MHLAQFLGLVSPEWVTSILEASVLPKSRQIAVGLVLDAVTPASLEELGLDSIALAGWADIAFGLSSMAVNYMPSGSVPGIDVFHAVPLRAAAKSREDWVENHLAKWVSFCSGEVRLHQVAGEHYTMLGREHVISFSETLKRALRERGV